MRDKKARGGFLLLAASLIFMTGCYEYPRVSVADSMKEFRSLIPGIQAALALGAPAEATSRALDPIGNPPQEWPYGSAAPADVYAAAGGVSPSTVTLPSTGYYTMANGDKVTLTMTPDTTLGSSGFFRIEYYTYPVVDLSVQYTLEDYYVNSNAAWPWGNLDSSGNSGYIALSTSYTDGTTGERTLVWTSGASGAYYPAFTVGEPDPFNTSSFIGYRYEESDTPPAASASGLNYSSNSTEHIKGKAQTVIDSTHYYTETTGTSHSGLTYVLMNKKQKWAFDTQIVTRMQEDTSAATKKIRSVGEVGTFQYYIDKVDISKNAYGQVVYTNIHDVYFGALPRSVGANADEGQSLEVTEDSAGSGTFTGTLEEVMDGQQIIRDVTMKRGATGAFVLSYKYRSGGARGLGSDVELSITEFGLSNISLPVSELNGTFDGYYEAGSLYGTLTTPHGLFDIVVGVEGVAVNDVLYSQ
jgi:hypothetical protein